MIIDDLSVFRTQDFLDGKPTFFNDAARRAHRRAGLSRVVPSPSIKPNTRRILQALRHALMSDSRSARVLVVGCGFGGEGIDILETEQITLIETDVALTPRTQIVCDCHNLPFADSYFDAVVAQDVIQSVVEPTRCAQEIARVVREGGFVYAEVAFVQQVSAGNYDFHRFTQLGLRRLFRDFCEIRSGVAMGPATAFVWGYESLLQTAIGSRKLRPWIKAFARVTAYPFKLIDLLISERPEALDGASSIYFLGRKDGRRMTDREIIASYEGAWPVSLVDSRK